jgi:hypothetical protein
MDLTNLTIVFTFIYIVFNFKWVNVRQCGERIVKINSKIQLNRQTMSHVQQPETPKGNNFWRTLKKLSSFEHVKVSGEKIHPSNQMKKIYIISLIYL